ncbi:MAG: sulfatase [Myxococcales bacterium]|nr:sulfatase-like hydrolase/transferase [Polyangiaceae bacterium]MDW8248864.1 sulfatase [Myxococcales bacterium]
MSPHAAVWMGRALALVLLVASALVVARRGQGARPPAPRSSSCQQPAPLAPSGRSVLQVEWLADRLDQASFVVPRLQAGLRMLRNTHWRAMTAPYARVSGERRQAVQVVAWTLGTEKIQEGNHTVGLRSAAELRTWNTAEASFDIREALLAPPPSTLRFPLKVPPQAILEVAPAVVGLMAGSLTFEVAARPRGGDRLVLDVIRVRASSTPAWNERRIGLDSFAGQEIDLELTVRGGPPELERTPAALWGAPALISRRPAEVPYNVLWFVVDTMRPDTLPAWHTPERTAALARAKLPPLDAWLPPVSGLTPGIDSLAECGVSFVDTTSAATWTRPGTLAMLSGARSSQLGLDTTPWVLPSTTVAKFYASSPPLLPLILRRHRVRTQALVNNFFLTGYARAGLDLGFVGMVDHRHEIQDTERITRDALAWLERHRDERFFLFVNLNSPHGPYVPPKHCGRRVPRDLSNSKTVRLYVAEFCKDDEAVGAILRKLDELGLTEETLVILTADHGETLSQEHDLLIKGLDEQAGSTRFHHANAMFEETTRVPLIFSLPGRLPAGVRRTMPAQTTDIVPTILELQGLPIPEKVRGMSLLPWALGAPPRLERPIVSEGRASRSIRVGRYRYVERDAEAQWIVQVGHGVFSRSEELYDLEEDPGERRNIAEERPEEVAKLRTLLAEALATSTAQDAQRSAALAGSRYQPRDNNPPARLRLRFAPGGQSRKWTIFGKLADPEPGAPEPRIKGSVFQADPSALRVEGREFDAVLLSTGRELVGLDLEISPSSTPIRWSLQIDERPLPPEQIFGGTYGLKAPLLLEGIGDAESRLAATAEATPIIDPLRDLGLFVLREPSADVGLAVVSGGEAMREVQQLLETWGYAAGSSKQVLSR